MAGGGGCSVQASLPTTSANPGLASIFVCCARLSSPIPQGLQCTPRLCCPILWGARPQGASSSCPRAVGRTAVPPKPVSAWNLRLWPHWEKEFVSME